MRAVVDTVVFLRALINPKSRSGRLLLEQVDRYTVVLSLEIVEEILDVLNRPALRQRFPQMAALPERAAVLSAVQGADLVMPTRRFAVCRDPDDNKLIDCAVEAQADYIVTEDNDLLDLREVEGVKIVNTREFLSVLGVAA